VSRWDRWPTRVASGNATGRLPRGKPDEGEPHVRLYVEWLVMLRTLPVGRDSPRVIGVRR
jgi:hypothetical protein